MPDKVIVVFSKDDLDNKILEYTRPFFEKYAEKLGVQVLYQKSIAGKFDLFHILKDYNRAISFTPKILIRPDCPDLFEIVPADKIGLFNEAQYNSSIQDFYEAKRHYDEYKNSIKKPIFGLREWSDSPSFAPRNLNFSILCPSTTVSNQHPPWVASVPFLSVSSA
jgi:hypothetical protein